jgi:hypothetical protein
VAIARSPPHGEGLLERVRAIAPHGVDAVLEASSRGEIPLSIELAGGPQRVLTLVALDAADTGIQVFVGATGDDRVLHCARSSPFSSSGGSPSRSGVPSSGRDLGSA